ncbi:hypothetical protein ABZ671_12005 [Micromonospora sp. NPDC006766]|uniref:hypothetical protein n=1 Tax=Micromonospora sp. NPDC006766 TaxID=3154778 RepID=UPI0033E40CCD
MGAGVVALGAAIAVVLTVALTAEADSDQAGVIINPPPPPPSDVAVQSTAAPSAKVGAASASRGVSAGTGGGRRSGAPSTEAPSPAASSTGVPRPASWPSKATTGVPKSKTLKAAGDVRVTKNSAVVDGLDVRGTITVEANNVTIRNTRVTNAGKSEWGIIQRAGFSGLVIVDSEIRGNGKQEMQQGIFNLGDDLTVRRTDISQVADGIDTKQGLIEHCYLHDPSAFDGDHVDLIQVTGGPPVGKSLVIRHNTVINNLNQTSAIGLFQDFGVMHDVLVVNNYLAGGGYTVYGGDGDKGASRNVRFEHNTFGRDVYPKGGRWGPVAYFTPSGPGNTWKGNVWAVTGAPVTP